VNLHDKSREVCIKARSPPALLPFKGQVTEQTTVKWTILDKKTVVTIILKFNENSGVPNQINSSAFLLSFAKDYPDFHGFHPKPVCKKT